MQRRLKIIRDVDPLEHTPLLRGVMLAFRYAEEHGCIGLTKSKALNRKFVTHAAEVLNWPGYTADDLYVMNKVLNEEDMPPLWPVHDIVLHLKLMRRYKGTLRNTRKGSEFLHDPEALFNLVATVFLYSHNHDDRLEHSALNWDILLNVINVEARGGFQIQDLIGVLYGLDQSRELRFSIRFGVLRPLCWLGLLVEDREGLRLLDDGTYFKSPLWQACLELETDEAPNVRLV